MKQAIGETRDLLKESQQRREKRQEILEKERIFTLANLLSLVRLILLPFVILCLFANEPRYDLFALILLLIAGITDFFDGIAARVRNEVSQLGKIIDPVADKLFIGSLGLILVFLRGLPAWYVAIFIVRDFLILTIAYVLFLNRDIVLTSNWLGKSTTAVLLLTLVVFTMRWETVGMPLVYLGTVMVLASGVIYARNFIHLMSSMRSTKRREGAQQEKVS